jgi:hypothetical protein
MNSLPNSSPRGPLDVLRRLPVLVLRVVLGLVGLVFTLGLVTIGLVAGTVLVAWALLRGRRPEGLRFDIRRGGVFHGSVRRRSTSSSDVVDIEAREVTEPTVRP